MKDKAILRKRLLNLTIPIFIESLLVILLGTMDTIMLSRYSDSSVASVGVVNQVFNMIIVVFNRIAKPYLKENHFLYMDVILMQKV